MSKKENSKPEKASNPEKFIVSLELINATIGFLGEQKYSQVAGLINMWQNELKKQGQIPKVDSKEKKVKDGVNKK